jgi:hypothetical protein
MSSKKDSLSAEEIVTERPMGRRSTLGLFGVGAIGALATACGGGGAYVRGTACTDSDPQDPAGGGRGRGISDSDPTDPVGCGSRACSDSDPNDPAGRGRHC